MINQDTVAGKDIEKNKRIKKKKVLKYELRNCEVETTDIIGEDLEDAARRHICEILKGMLIN